MYDKVCNESALLMVVNPRVLLGAIARRTTAAFASMEMCSRMSPDAHARESTTGHRMRSRKSGYSRVSSVSPIEGMREWRVS
jgi:hypothetical protein